jgi:hypothetical protein
MRDAECGLFECGMRISDFGLKEDERQASSHPSSIPKSEIRIPHFSVTVGLLIVTRA